MPQHNSTTRLINQSRPRYSTRRSMCLFPACKRFCKVKYCLMTYFGLMVFITLVFVRVIPPFLRGKICRWMCFFFSSGCCCCLAAPREGKQDKCQRSQWCLKLMLTGAQRLLRTALIHVVVCEPCVRVHRFQLKWLVITSQSHSPA